MSSCDDFLLRHGRVKNRVDVREVRPVCKLPVKSFQCRDTSIFTETWTSLLERVVIGMHTSTLSANGLYDVDFWSQLTGHMSDLVQGRRRRPVWRAQKSTL